MKAQAKRREIAKRLIYAPVVPMVLVTIYVVVYSFSSTANTVAVEDKHVATGMERASELGGDQNNF